MGGKVWSRMARGNVWMYVLQLVLTWGLYVGVPGLQGTDSGPQTHLMRRYEPVGGANF
jgi:hypothetical protein